MSSNTNPTPDEARVMLDQVDQLGVTAAAGISWPYISTLLTMGAATSLGTLAMSMSTGARFMISMIAMLLWIMVSIGFMMGFGRATRLGFTRRWRLSMGAWGAAYLVAVVIASTSEGENLVGGVIGASLIAVVTITGALIEARS